MASACRCDQCKANMWVWPVHVAIPSLSYMDSDKKIKVIAATIEKRK